ncbi:MAG: arylesterase, partial [Bacteroidota bacterium]
RLLLNKICLTLLLLGLISCGEPNPTSEQTTQKNNNTPTNKVETPKTVAKKKKKQIIFFGDSLTAGYGLDDPADSFVGVIQEKLEAANLDYKAVNAGVSGETSSGGEERVDWILQQSEIDIFVLELGANDGLRGIKTEETIQNLQSIFDKVKAKFPDAKLVLAGMLAPPNMGVDFTEKFAAIFPKVAKENDAALIPFLLDGVGGIPALNQRDGIHPTVEGHQILADNVWKVLKDIL